MTLNDFEGHFGDLLTVVTLYAQPTRDLLAMAKFLVSGHGVTSPGDNRRGICFWSSVYLLRCLLPLQQYRTEAQLSQRDRATSRVIEYFAKSLKVNQGHSK